MSKNELTAVQEEIAKLEMELAEGAPIGGDVPTMPPKLELVSDKATKKGVFTLGTKNGDKLILGEDATIVYVHQGAEVRTLMADTDERPRCAAVDGVPAVADPKAPSCFKCAYDGWEKNEAGKNERYRDAEGLRCRVKRHAVVNVLVYEGDIPQAFVPAVLVIPPASLGAERIFKSDLRSLGRIQGRGSLGTALVRLGWEWKKSGKFEFAALTFKSLGLASAQVPPDLWLTHLQDAKAIKAAIEDGTLQHAPHNDAGSQRAFDEQRAEEVDGSEDDAPF